MPDVNHHSRAVTPEFALLGFLVEGPAHGYSLHRKVMEQFGYVWHISQSQSYSILKRLETQGFITSKVIEQEKLPPRQVMQITPGGRRRFRTWLVLPSGSSVRAIRLDFITRLYFIQKLYPDRLPALFSSQSAEISAALVRLEKALEGLPPEQLFNRLGLELRIRQLRSISAWLEECRQTIQVKESN